MKMASFLVRRISSSCRELRDMQMGKHSSDIEYISGIAAVAFNFALVMGMLFTAIGLVAPLTGGRLLLGSIIHSVIWIGFGLAGRNMLKHVRKELRIRAYDYSLICLFIMVGIFVRIVFPLNLLLCILFAVFAIVTYRAHIKWAGRMAELNSGE